MSISTISISLLKFALDRALAVELEHAVYPDFSRFETRGVITKMLLLSGRDKYSTHNDRSDNGQ